MGNLLGSPITEKDTHVGITHDSHSSTNNNEDTNNNSTTSPDGGGLHYGISSMQGWRIHMEDAHIAQPFLYAEELNSHYNNTKFGGGDEDEDSPSKKTAIEATLSTSDENSNEDNGMATEVNVTAGTSNSTKKYHPIPLPNHALFAVFDGHGGSFAAEYASRNLLRILCRSKNFVEYAKQWRGREDYLKGLLIQQDDHHHDTSQQNENELEGEEEATKTPDGKSADGGKSNDDDDKARLQQLQKRGRESDEKVKQIKEQVKRHLDGEVDISVVVGVDGSTSTSSNTFNNTFNNTTSSSSKNNNNNKSYDEIISSASSSSSNQQLQIARATYDHQLMTLLEHALRDAFIDVDAEILRVVRGDELHDIDADVNVPYGAGYDLSRHSLEGCVGHLPKEGTSGSGSTSSAEEGDNVVVEGSNNNVGDVVMKDEDGENAQSNNSTNSTQTTIATAPPPPDNHPTPSADEDAGTTAVVVLTTPKWIVCANAGDSRAVYSRSSHRAVPLSYDHKPDDEDEERRIREAGGYVSGGRVEGDLAVSRGLGDYRFKDMDAVLSGSRGESIRRSTGILQRQIKNSLQGGQQNSDDDEDVVPMFKPSEQKVSPVPDIIVQNRDPAEDEFIIIACDGIWDVQTNQECVRMVAEIFGEGEDDLGLVCEEVLDQCLIKGSKDNMTAAVIKFPKQTIGTGGGVAARRERRKPPGGGNSDENNNGAGGEVHLRRVYNPYVPPAQRDNGSGGSEG